MMIFWIFLALAVVFALVLLGVGIYELIVETRHDSVRYDNQYLHLKHLEHINNGK